MKRKQTFYHYLTEMHLMRGLVCFSLFISLIAGVTDHIFPTLFGRYTLSSLLALHRYGLQEKFLWQLITHPFIHPTIHGIDLSYLIGLLFSSYLFWKLGTTLLQLKEKKHFFALLVGSTLASSLVATMMFIFGHGQGFLAGGTPLLYSMLLAVVILLPELDLLLFLTIPIKAKWFIVMAMGAFLLIDLSHGNFIHFFSIFGALTFTYFYSLLAWRSTSPFRFLHPFEKFLIHLTEVYFSPKAVSSDTLQNYAHNAKIYDFKTGRILLDDDTFLDACLAKIADQGMHSLSWRERWRMRKIAKKKHFTSSRVM